MTDLYMFIIIQLTFIYSDTYTCKWSKNNQKNTNWTVIAIGILISDKIILKAGNITKFTIY